MSGPYLYGKIQMQWASHFFNFRWGRIVIPYGNLMPSIPAGIKNAHIPNKIPCSQVRKPGLLLIKLRK